MYLFSPKLNSIFTLKLRGFESSKGAHNRNFAQFNNCNLDFIMEIFNALTMNDD